MIVCLGTTPAVQRTMLFDRLTLDAVNRAAETRQYGSGKSINAARVLHTLGKPVTALGFVGGSGGEFIAEDLDRIGLAHDFVMVAAATRTCVTLVDRSAGTATELVEESSAVSAADYDQLLSKLETRAAQATALILSGTLPPSAPEDFYARCIAAAGNLTVIVDAKGEPLRQALSHRPTIVKPNRGELAETVGMRIESDDGLKAAICKLLEAGPKWAVITGGGGYTVASDGRGFWRVRTPAVPVISPIGSGDAFAAGLAAAVVEGQDIPTACRLAVACGSANAMTPLAAHLRPDDVNALLPQITVEPF